MPLVVHGSIQGIVHSWLIDAENPVFRLRELSTDALVRVHYAPHLYADIAQAVQERRTMLIAVGTITFDPATRQAAELQADRIERVKTLSDEEFESFFGSAPGFVADDGFDWDLDASLSHG